MRYGRPVDCGDGPGIVRMQDVVTASSPLPEWAATPEEWLAVMFANQKPAWEAAAQWFVAIPDGVQPCAFHTGGDFTDPLSYMNPDGSYGDGSFPPPPGP